MIEKDLQFDVLGCRIKIRAEEVNAEGDRLLSPEHIVGLVLSEIDQMKAENSKLDDKQIAVLLALKFAKEKMVLESSLNIDQAEIYKNTSMALKLIEEVCSTTV